MALPKLIDLAPQITFLTGQVNYTCIHFTDAPRLLICKTLKDCTNQLEGFVRVHKTYIINPAFLDKIIREDQKADLLVADQLIPVSRRRHKDVLRQLGTGHPERWLAEPSVL